MRKTSLIFSTLVLLLAGLLSFSACEVVECGNGVCETGEDDPLDLAYCPQDCVSGGASASFTWYIHHLLGGADVEFGTWAPQEVCAFLQERLQLSGPPVIQLWEDSDNDDTADQRFDFACSAGQGLTTEEWNAGDTLKFAFALVDASGTLLSLTPTWDTQVLTAGVNSLGNVDFYIGDYGPLSVDLRWADKVSDPAFTTCELLDPYEVDIMGYLLNYSDGSMADESDIDVDQNLCRNNLTWDIIDFDTYTLVLDGEDSAGTTIWGSECQNLIVNSREIDANEYECQVIMTASP